jgi:hypothetical protein
MFHFFLYDVSSTTSGGSDSIFIKGFLVTMAKILIIANHNTSRLPPVLNTTTGSLAAYACALTCKANGDGLTNFIYHHMFKLSNVVHMSLNHPVCHNPKKFLKGPE